MNVVDSLTSTRDLLKSIDVFQKLYDMARVVDPLTKKVLQVTGQNTIELEGHCHGIWGKGSVCENCSSMRAFNENKVFIKMEYKQGRVYMVTSMPVEPGERTLVIEMMRDVTGSIVFSDTNNSDTELERYIQRFGELATRDELTGAFNRRYINERLPADIIRSKLENETVSLMMVDIDHFKRINDTYGHVVGDELLKEFVNVLQDAVSTDKDWVVRYGGEEFLVCVVSSEDECVIAERIRRTIEERVFCASGSPLRITASFGVCSGLEDTEALIKCADDKLYQAKRTGRNKVVC